jgi:phosphoglycolate phosphatase
VKSVMGHDLNLDPVVLSGNTDPGILRDAFRAAELEDAEWHPVLEDILEAMRSDVLSQRETMRVRVMPGVEATLEHLQAQGAALGVATGNLESIGWLKIEIAGLREWFSFGGFSDRFIVRAEMIAHAAALARAIVGADASVCVVGDTPFDISAARANDLPVIAVATGRYSFDELMQCNPDVCATTLEDLLEEKRRGA